MNEEEILREIHKDPEAFLREKKMYAVMALKLQIPELLRVQRIQRRLHWDSFEQANREQKKREIEIAAAVKNEKDPTQPKKSMYSNKESRDLEIHDRCHTDAAWTRWERQRASMYAAVKKIDEDIDYYERIDWSLMEVCAMFTSMMAYESSQSKEFGSDRDRKRASRRTGVAARTGQEPTFPT